MCQGKATAIIQSMGMSKYLCTLACGAISGERNGCPGWDRTGASDLAFIA
jgi:hypothetical protein